MRMNSLVAWVSRFWDCSDRIQGREIDNKPVKRPNLVDSFAIELGKVRRKSYETTCSDNVAVEVVNQTEAETTVTDRTVGLRFDSAWKPIAQTLMRTSGIVVLDIGLDEVA